MQSMEIAEHSDSGGRFSSLAAWWSAHKIHAAVIIGGFFIVALFSIGLGFGITLYQISQIKMDEDSETEIFDLCSDSNPYSMAVTMNNPSTTTAHFSDFDLIVKHEDGTPVLSTRIPALDLPPGKTKINFMTNAKVEDEAKLASVLQEWFNEKEQKLTMEYTVQLKALGISITANLKSEIAVGKKDPNVPPSTRKLETMEFINATSPSFLAARLNINYNNTSPGFTVHIPQLWLDILQNDSLISNTSLAPLIFRKGSNSILTDLFLAIENLPSISKISQKFMNNDQILVQFSGSQNSSQECLLQRLVGRIKVNGNLTADSSQPSAFTLEDVSIKNVNETVGLRANFNSTIMMLGVVPSIEIDAFNFRAEKLAAIKISAYLFPEYGLEVDVKVTNISLIGEALSMLMDNGAYFRITGSNENNVTLITKVLRTVKWEIDTRNSTSKQSFFKVEKIELLGGVIGFYGLRIAIDFTLDAGYLEGPIPTISIRISNDLEELAVVSLESLVFQQQTQSHRAIIQIRLNQANLMSTLDDAFASKPITVKLSGSGQEVNVRHVIQDVLNNWRYQWKFNLSQGADGASVVEGGVMPEVQFQITNSTKDAISTFVILDFDLPLQFPIILGDLSAFAYYQNTLLVSASWPNVQLLPGKNHISPLVTLTAQYGRDKLEGLLSEYMFGTAAIPISLVGSLNKPGFSRAVRVEYNFTLPQQPAGNDTAVIRCVELVEMNPSVSVEFKNFLPTLVCSVDCQIQIWFYNPLPFPLTLQKVDFDVWFPDPDGVKLYGITWYDPGSPGQLWPFAQVREPSAQSAGNVLKLPQTPLTGETLNTAMHMITPPGALEICARMYENYSGDKLLLDILNGRATVAIQNFQVSLNFNWRGFQIKRNSPPCVCAWTQGLSQCN